MLSDIFARIIALDRGIFLAVNVGWATPSLDMLMTFVTLFGNGLFLAGVVLPILYFGDRKNFARRAPAVVMAVAIGGLINSFIKDAVDRPRPLVAFADEIRMGTVWVHTVFEQWRHYSFPSGHSQAAFGAATAVSYYYRGWIIPAVFAGAILVGISRIYLGVHFPLDVVGGAVVGITCSLVICRVWDWRWEAYLRKYGSNGAGRPFSISRIVKRIKRKSSTTR
jgi:undecaprenyl-diphosphatase